jgi:hypothetical protein
MNMTECDHEKVNELASQEEKGLIRKLKNDEG